MKIKKLLRRNFHLKNNLIIENNNQIYNNEGSEFKIGYMTSVGAESSIIPLIENNDFDDDDGYVVEMVSDIEEDRLGEELTMRNNYWGELATAEMNEGDNPKDITPLFDYFDNGNRHLINYSGWEGSEGAGTGYTATLNFVDIGISVLVDDVVSFPLIVYMLRVLDDSFISSFYRLALF